MKNIDLKSNKVITGDAKVLARALPVEVVDIIISSPPYWGQRASKGFGEEVDPRDYLDNIVSVFVGLKDALSADGVIWVNLGDSYNTDINWRYEDKKYSTLGKDRTGLNGSNKAYTKERIARKAFVDKGEAWLKKANLLQLPDRFSSMMVDNGFFYRGEIIWVKSAAMPEGRCPRPHRSHEKILLFSKSQNHRFTRSPPVKTVWEMRAERSRGIEHCSRFPVELPIRCMEASGDVGSDTLVLDPFSGSGTTGLAAKFMGCGFIGFEIDSSRTKIANKRIKEFDDRKFVREMV